MLRGKLSAYNRCNHPGCQASRCMRAGYGPSAALPIIACRRVRASYCYTNPIAQPKRAAWRQTQILSAVKCQTLHAASCKFIRFSAVHCSTPLAAQPSTPRLLCGFTQKTFLFMKLSRLRHLLPYTANNRPAWLTLLTVAALQALL